jgi:hypothetical protein
MLTKDMEMDTKVKSIGVTKEDVDTKENTNT